MDLDPEDVREIIGVLRRIGTETERVEVKSGSGGFPRSVVESVVAFANGDGGTVLIGVDESCGFAVVPVPEIASYRDRLAQLSRDEVTPALQITIDIVPVEDGLVLVALVPPARPDQKPVYVTSKGVSTGAYIRSGDGDRRMTEAEIALTIGARTQPRYDIEAVEGTAVPDLDQGSLLRTLQRVRAGSTALRTAEDVVVLRRLNILTAARDHAPVTLAGLLTYGVFPQEQFPQLMASVVVHPPEGDSGARFLDNVTVRGNIPEIVSEALAVIRRNLAARAVMSEFGRSDRLDYPLEAIREALVNALLHRDYSPVTRGTQVQVDLYPDRLVIRSPGGLHGGIAVDELGEEGTSSSRNAVLASLLSDTYLPQSSDLVAENRASGIPAMIALARSHGLPRPVFKSTITSFTVTMGRSELLGPEVKSWIGSLGASLPTPTHEVALAMLRGGPITNAMLREWGVDRIAAGQVLRDLVEQGLAVREGGRRYAQYLLDPSVSDQDRRREPDDLFSGLVPDTETELRRAGQATAADLHTATGLSRRTVLNHLGELIAQGLVTADGVPRSPKRSYRWIGPTAAREDRSRPGPH